MLSLLLEVIQRVKQWIFAQSKTSIHSLSTQHLTLRKNGKFTNDFNEADFSCSMSVSLLKNGDSIIQAPAAIVKINSEITSIYLLKNSELKPLIETNNKITFSIKQ